MSIGLTTAGATCLDQQIIDTNALGVNVYADASGCEIARCDIGPNKNSNVLLQTHELAAAAHHVHHNKLHESGANGGMTYHTHGLYDASADSLVEYNESHVHPNGHCFSPRWPNTYYRNTSSISNTDYGVFDYSDGRGGLLLIREELSYVINDWWIYFGPGRTNWHDGSAAGPLTFSLIADHCTLDLRKCADHGVNLQELIAEAWLTNCCIISDNPSYGWLLKPNSGVPLYMDGTVVLTTAQANTYLNPDYTPKDVSGSPLVGKAVASPGRSGTTFGNLPDVGRYQLLVSPPPASTRDLKAVSVGFKNGTYYITGTRIAGGANVTWQGTSRVNAIATVDKLLLRLQ